MNQTPLKIAGEESLSIHNLLTERVNAKVASGAMPKHECEYVSRLNLLPTRLEDGQMRALDPVHLERLKTLCQLWDVQIRDINISSHRPYIGPVIVFAKKILVRLMCLVLKDSMRQQRDFNAGVIALLSDLCSKNIKN